MSNKTEPVEGELWSRANRPVLILRPKGEGYLLATIRTEPGQKPLTKAELTNKLKGYKKVGQIVSETPAEEGSRPV